jgi:hypothetical protein
LAKSTGGVEEESGGTEAATEPSSSIKAGDVETVVEDREVSEG